MPEIIYDDLIDIEAAQSGSYVDSGEGLCSDGQMVWLQASGRDEDGEFESEALMAVQPSSTSIAFPQLQQPLITQDIQELLAEAAAPIENRRRTIAEWFNSENIREKQLANKLWAGQAANTLVQQRIEFMDSVSDIARRADDFRRERLEAQLTAIELEDQIAERLALRNTRLATLCAIEAEKQRKLLEPAPTPEPERERTLREHRLDRQARVQAGRDLIDDFLREVDLVCQQNVSVHHRALQLRNILAAFEMDEDSLPADARWVLETAEKLRDGV